MSVDENEEIRSSSLSVLASVCSLLKNGVFPYVVDIVSVALHSLRVCPI